MEGKSDGKDQQRQVDEIILRLLSAKMEECQRALAFEEENCVESDIERQLWGAELRIAHHMEALIRDDSTES